MFSNKKQYEECFQVTSEVVDQFIDLSHDRNPLHTDGDFAKSKGFASSVAHGNILNAFISYFVGQCLPTQNVVIQKQSIKYHLPVYVGDSLILRAQVDYYSDAVKTVELSFHFIKQDQKKVATGKLQIGLL